ncbi:hypothetical protein GE09DRAFT_1217314 [Coniochaeta sp. 2T2.1]|nr:hypothetical protein GE09DRAFT_1217314 [Coniochaeta sp. 2T2.1]
MTYPAEIASLLIRQAADATTTPPVMHGPEVFDEITTGMQKFGFAIILFFPILAFITCVLRVYGRLSAKQLGIDDLLVCVAMAMSIGETAATYMFMKTNFIGIHIWDVPAPGTYPATPGLIWNFAVQVLYNPILALVKTSVLIFLLRLGGQKPGVRYAIHALNIFNIALMVAIFLVVIFQCNPVAFNWNPSLNGTCIKQGEFYLVTAALTIFTDLLVLALPIWIFADLKMKLKLKIALIIVFLLGFIVTIVGIARLVFIYQGFFVVPGPNADPTYTLGFCTSAIETNLAIITASAPALRPLFRKWFPRLFSTRTGGGSAYPDTYGLSGNHRSRITAGRSEHHHGGSMTPGMVLKDLKDKSQYKVRSHSPSASEEEIMTFNGIMRTTAVRVSYAEEDMKDEDRATKEARQQKHKEDYGMRTSISGSI